MTNGRIEERFIVNDTHAARLLRRLSPDWGWCFNCGIPWSYVDHHTTHFSATEGCFPLCVPCWDELGAEAKLHCYRMYAEDTEQLDRWPEIASALAVELGHRPGQRTT